MEIKISKCAATGKLYSNVKNNAIGAGININNRLEKQLGQLKLSGQKIPYLPPNESYKYLGIWINMDLNWNEHYKHTVSALKTKGDKLLACNAPLSVKLDMLQKVVRPTATYAFPLAIFTNMQIDGLDCILAQYGKRVMGIPNTFATTAILQPREKGGAGLLSYHIDYKQQNITQAAKVLNNVGRLGAVSSELLRHHYNKYTGGTQASKSTTTILYRLNTTLRQFQLANAADVKWVHDHTPYFPIDANDFAEWQERWTSTTPDTLAIPHKAMETLWSLGMANMQALIDTTKTCHGQRMIITTSQVKHMVGSSKMKKAHCIALNQLTLALNASDREGSLKAAEYRCPKPLGPEHRTIHPAHLQWAVPMDVMELANSVHDKCRMHPLEHLWAQAAAQPPDRTKEPPSWTPPTQLPPNLPPLTQVSQQQRSTTDNSQQGRRRKEPREAYYTAHKRQALTACCNKPIAGKDKDHCMKCKLELDDTRTMLECHICQGGMHLECNDPPLQKPPKGEWVCHDCQQRQSTMAQLCGSVLKEHKQHAKTLGILRSSLGPHPHTHVEHVKSLCANPNITWAAYLALYSEQDEALAVVGGPSTIYNRAQKRSKTDASQTRYLVQWEYTYVIAHHVQTAIDNGYTPDNIRDAMPEDKHDVPYILQQLGYCTDTNLMQQLKRVTWKPTWEPESSTKSDHMQALLGAYIQTQAAAQAAAALKAPPQPRHNIAIHNLERGAGPDGSNAADVALDRQITANLTLNTRTINPDLDIMPTGRCTIQYGLCNGSAWHKGEHMQLAHVYDAQGRHVGTINANRLAILYRNFQHTAHTQPHLHEKVVSFEAELVKLLARYKDGYQHISNSSQRTKLKNHWATPDRYMHVIQRHFNTVHERFSSPLNYNPVHAVHWTMYKEDKVFGAQHNAFSTPWVGTSQANPEYESSDMERAVRWAVHSSTMQDTSTTIFVLPKWHFTTYRTWLQHSNVVEYCTINRRYFPFKTGDHWSTVDEKAYAQEPKWDVKIFAVTNNPKHKAKESIEEFKQAFFNVATDKDGNKPTRMDQCFLMLKSAPSNAKDHMPPPPSKLSKLMRNPGQASTQLMHLPTSQPRYTAAQLYPATVPLRYNVTDYTYTDGSCIQTKQEGQKIGAATVKLIPGEGNSYTATYIDPAGHGLTNTINRAELAAIHAAICSTLRQEPLEQPLHILTDSLASIYMISNTIYKPTTQFGHTQGDVLQDIVHLLHARGEKNGKTTIGKIKSHIGCVGNELADTAAKEVALGTRDADYTCPSNPEPLRGMAWPAEEYVKDDGTTAYRYAANLNKWARAKAYNAELNREPTSGRYAALWHDAAKTDLNNKYSHNFWDNQPSNVSRTIMRLRWGKEYNAKHALQMKKPYASNGRMDGVCPLDKCGEPDGCGHMLGGCRNPTIRSIIIKRHNEAVQLIYKAILASDIGGSYTVMDAGHLPGETLHSRIPGWMLPNTPDDVRRRMRPDLLLITGLTQRETNEWAEDKVVKDKGKYVVHILEVGYGSDVSLEDKERTKLEQHTQLIAALQEEGWKTEYTAIPLGTTGGIPNSTVKALTEKLHLSNSQADTTFRRLHDLAVRSAHALVRKRRQLEYNKDSYGTHNRRNNVHTTRGAPTRRSDPTNAHLVGTVT